MDTDDIQGIGAGGNGSYNNWYWQRLGDTIINLPLLATITKQLGNSWYWQLSLYPVEQTQALCNARQRAENQDNLHRELIICGNLVTLTRGNFS